MPGILKKIHKTIFFRLMVSFLLIILILSSFYLYSYRAFLGIIDGEIKKSMDYQLDMGVRVIDRSFEEIKNAMAQVCRQEAFLPVKEGRALTQFDRSEIVNKMKKDFLENGQNDFIRHISALFIVTFNPEDILIESRGTYNRDKFYSVFFQHPVFNEKFWKSEINENFAFKIYPMGKFTDSSQNIVEERLLLPIAYKSKTHANYMMVALVDVLSVIRAAEMDPFDHLFIYGKADELIFPQSASTIFPHEEDNNGKGYIKLEEGYLFQRHSPSNGLQYYKLVSDYQVKQKLARVNTVFKIVLTLSILLSILIATLIVIRFNNPVKQMAALIKKTGRYDGNANVAENLYFIRDMIGAMIRDNEKYAMNISRKNLQLREFVFQSSVKDVYLNDEELKLPFHLFRRYQLILFKIHYNESFIKENALEPGKTTYFFKDLIQLYIHKYFSDSITFSMENDQIISIINVSDDGEKLDRAMEEIAATVRNEEPFAYFTILVSDAHEEFAQVKNVYMKMEDCLKLRKMRLETQVIRECDQAGYKNRYFITDVQWNLLDGFIAKRSEEDCRQLVNAIIEANAEKGVSCWGMYRLCMDILNHGLKTREKEGYPPPAELDMPEIIGRLERCATVEALKQTFQELITVIFAQIEEQRGERDHIVEFVCRYIEGHYQEDLYLDLFAEKLNLSPSYVSSYFKGKMQVNLIDYLNQYRIKKAMEIMENPQSKVKDVAQAVGILNVNSFIRLFKKYCGCTPKEYWKSKV